MSTDQEWARDLFERSRQAEEPVWAADHAALMTAGRRRSRNRTLTASGGAVAAVAVAAAVGIGVMDGGGSKTHQPPPGGAPTTKGTPASADTSHVLDYAGFGGWNTKDNKSQDPDYFKKYYIAVPDSASRDTMRLLTQLDPTLSHIAKHPSGDTHSSNGVRTVPDDDPMARDMNMLSSRVLWSDSGAPVSTLSKTGATSPYGTLKLTFQASSAIVPGETLAQGADCTPNDSMEAGMLQPESLGDNGWTDKSRWDPCTLTTLPDKSTLQTSTRSYGQYSISYAVRRFPGDAGAVELLWWNYAVAMDGRGPGQPDPKRVLTPNPITTDKLKAALSDPGLKPPLTPAPAAAPPSTMLQASDFGPGWTFDAGQSHATTGALVVEDGCTNEQNMVVNPQPVYTYTGTTPSGIGVTASAGVNVMKAGSGPGWMTELRKHGTGGCDQGEMKFSQDSMSTLPSGIGDDAFIENWVGQGNETIFVRFKDDVLRLDVTTPGHKMPAFTAQDKEWFAALAGKAAARHGGK